MRQQPDDELCPLTPGVLLGFDEGLQVPEDAQRVADLSDPERVTRRHPAVLVAGIRIAPHPSLGLVWKTRPSGWKRTHLTVPAGATAVMLTAPPRASESTQRKWWPTAISPPKGPIT